LLIKALKVVITTTCEQHSQADDKKKCEKTTLEKMQAHDTGLSKKMAENSPIQQAEALKRSR
jgi:hypothetical protein